MDNLINVKSFLGMQFMMSKQITGSGFGPKHYISTSKRNAKISYF